MIMYLHNPTNVIILIFTASVNGKKQQKERFSLVQKERKETDDRKKAPVLRCLFACYANGVYRSDMNAM